MTSACSASDGQSQERRIGRGVSEDDPSFTGTYKVPLIGIEVSNGRSELKSGVRLAGIEIYQVFPDSPGMRGHGQSADPGPDHKWSAEELLLDMKGFLDTLGLDQVHYLGESIGGTLGIAFAVRSPERLKSLTLLATPTSIPAARAKALRAGLRRLADRFRQARFRRMGQGSDGIRRRPYRR